MRGVPKTADGVWVGPATCAGWPSWPDVPVGGVVDFVAVPRAAGDNRASCGCHGLCGPIGCVLQAERLLPLHLADVSGVVDCIGIGVPGWWPGSGLSFRAVVRTVADGRARLCFVESPGTTTRSGATASSACAWPTLTAARVSQGVVRFGVLVDHLLCQARSRLPAADGPGGDASATCDSTSQTCQCNAPYANDPSGAFCNLNQCTSDAMCRAGTTFIRDLSSYPSP